MNKSHTQCNKKWWITKLLIAIIIIFSAVWIVNSTLKENKANAAWQPHRFINQDFWNANPSSGNIITALFGDQSNTESSPYTRFWTWMNCNITENDIIVVNTGNIDSLNVNNITWNKIYLVQSGTYEINNITPKSCSAIIGRWDVTFKKNGINPVIIIDNGSNIIIDNIKINGDSKQKQWIYLNNSHNNTINNVEVYRNSNNSDGVPIWIHLYQSHHNSIQNSRIHDNQIGIKLEWSQHNYINKSQIYNHWITANSGSYGIFIKGEDGTMQATWAHSNYNTINNNFIYNNSAWVYMQKWSGSTNIVGGELEVGLKHILFWVYAAPTPPKPWGSVSYNMITNSQIFNNNQSITIKKWQNNIFYNNTMYNSMIIYTWSSTISDSNIMWDAYIFNSHGLIDSWMQIIWSGDIYIFDIPYTYWPDIEPADNITGSYTLHTWYSTSHHLITQPINALWDKLFFWQKSNWIGNKTFFAYPPRITQPIKYIFGKSIPKQAQPMRHNEDTNTREPFGIEWLDRDPTDFIASVNMEINSEDENLVNYYYGPDSEFTANWNENNCSLWAFTVEHIDTQAKFNNKVLSPLWHTIYVLEENNYTISWNNLINIQDNCIAIVSKNENKTIKRNWATIDPLIKINGWENIILDGLNLDGSNLSQYGILLEKDGNYSSNNNTVNNIKSYNHQKDGIRLWLSSSYNTIMNTQTWNNKGNGIEIFQAGLYNIINNSLSYNNTGYGIRFGNISKYNTINNSQFFNNNIGGIFADFTSEQNILNNIHIYNNKDAGLDIKRSSWNSLHKMYIYHNKIGIRVRDTTSVNNKFNRELVMFDNRWSNLSGTNGNDNFLSAELANSSLGREWWNLIQEESEMSCSWATNPNGNNWFFNTNSGCVNTGKQNTRTPTYPNNINYLFGLGISKQIEPVGYNIDNEIVNLNNQFNPDAHIWEINPIIWTNPGTITISEQEQNLDLGVNHEMEITYSSNMINHNFDVKLTGNFSGIDIHLEIKQNNQWSNIWTGQENIDFEQIQWIKIKLTTPDDYYQTVSGTIYIWTQEYGNGTATFNIKTKPNPTPPTITWSGNISTEALWHGEANTWQAIVSGEYTTTATYSYVTGADDCITWAVGTNYNGNIKNIISESNYNSLNDKYVCVVAKDTVNGEYTTGLSNQIKISKMDFVDWIAIWPVFYDAISLQLQNIYNTKYQRVSSWTICNSGLSNSLWWIEYDDTVLINNMSLNGKYMCVYGENGLWSGRYIISANKLNIASYSNRVRFIDDVSPIWVSSDNISVYFSGGITFSHQQYKWVENISDCDNSGSMIAYTGGNITIDHEWLNGHYFCLYTREQQGWVENYLISSYPLKIDATNPTEPSIIYPTHGSNIHWLIIETVGAIDEESGLAGFEYEIAENATFLDVINSGTAYTTENTFSPIFNEAESIYSIRIRAVDKVGNKSNRSNSVDINYKQLQNFQFQDVSNAQLLTAYVSNEILMWWLWVNEIIKASVTNWTLYRNGNPLGNSGYVQNNDKLSIKMISSSIYSGVTQTELKIANRIVPRKITTVQTGSIGGSGTIIDTGFNLSTQDMLMVQMMFNSIITMYQNPSQLHSFLLTMSSILQDNIALAWEWNAENLRYLLHLIQQYLAEHFNNQWTGSVHKAPNCKEYTITYDTGDNTYYSPNTVKQIRFGSRDELVKYLDVNNPGDCHVNIYGNTTSYNNTDPNRHIAPNGKVYNIQSNNLWYSSPEFITVKYFASIVELRTFIDKNNPAIVVWDHTVDTTFEPITHTAPNWKAYKIYKTNKWYMSYKLMKVQYYWSLDELKNYIDKNNKK